jgi:glucokinase-like ROK family protein
MTVPLSGRYRAGDQGLLRQINLLAILHHLRESAPLSRVALAEMTGLNKATVSSLVNELIQRQFVREIGLIESSRAGRRAMQLILNPQAGSIISAEIGPDLISVVSANFAPEIVWRHQETINPTMGQHAIFEHAVVLLQQAMEAGRRVCRSILGVAVGVHGLVDDATGTLLFAPNLGWRDVPLRSMLAAALQCPVFVDNEANLAALAEHYFGAARGFRDVLYISGAGIGLGGGIIHDGQIWRGASGIAGELGHMTMDCDGEPCNCGNRGCWETQVSQAALFRLVRRAIDGGRRSVLSSVDAQHLTLPMVVEAARAADSVALDALNTIGHYLGIGMASLVNVLNPELVVFGGVLSLAWEFLLPAVNDEMRHRALRWNQEITHVVPARHGFDACVMGGVAAVYQAVLAQAGSSSR